MKATKTYADLLREVFLQYKNHETEEYDTYQNSNDMCKAIKINVPDCPQWATPALVLKQWGNDVHHIDLILTAIAPEVGYNEDFNGILFTAHSTLSGKSNCIWGSPEGAMGGISRVINFGPDSDFTNRLMIEFITKIQDLSATGVYGVDPSKFFLREKQLS